MKPIVVASGLVALAALVATATAGPTPEPHPDLPPGACEGRWERPRPAVPFDGENVVRRPEGDSGPYSGFEVQKLFREARRHVATYAEGFIRDRPSVYKATFLLTAGVKARLAELRQITEYPANIRGLKACYTIRDLERLQRLVGDGLSGKGPSDPPIEGRVEFTDIRVKSNRVHVALRRFRKRDKQAIEARYGPAVLVLRGDHRVVPVRAR
jgi:hypothetical protein